MAFRFDWTPLHAVASLARQAGEAKASETRFAQNLAGDMLVDVELASLTAAGQVLHLRAPLSAGHHLLLGKEFF